MVCISWIDPTTWMHGRRVHFNKLRNCAHAANYSICTNRFTFVIIHSRRNSLPNLFSMNLNSSTCRRSNHTMCRIRRFSPLSPLTLYHLCQVIPTSTTRGQLQLKTEAAKTNAKSWTFDLHRSHLRTVTHNRQEWLINFLNKKII